MLIGYLILALVVVIAVAALIIFASDASDKYKTQRNIKAAGRRGEERTAYLLNSLPDNYKLIRNAIIEYDGKKSEIDNIVVGNTGVFIIETKNQNGRIIGDCQDKKWTQRKVGRGGTPYSKDFYNPTKQVATHIYRLKGLLKQNKIRVYINGSVYFSNPEATVKIVNPRADIPVFNYGNRNELLNYILNREKVLNNEQVMRIVKIIQQNNSHRI